MITEHNWAEVILVEVHTRSGYRFLDDRLQTTLDEESAAQFSHIEDAERWGKRYHGTFRTTRIKLPFRLEYRTDPRIDHWQPMRTYRTYDNALDGFADYLLAANASSLRDHVWRVIDTSTNTTIIAARPDQLSFVDKTIKNEPDSENGL